MFFGGKSVQKLFFGESEVKKIYLGSQLAWQERTSGLGRLERGFYESVGQSLGIRKRVDLTVGAYALTGKESIIATEGVTDPHFASVVFLAGFDGTDGSTTFNDESNSNHTLTAIGNAQIDTAQKKFGTASLLLDGTGDVVTVANSADFQFGSGQFTVELFARLSFILSGGSQSRFLAALYETDSQRSWAMRAVTDLSGNARISFIYSTNGTSGTPHDFDIAAPEVWQTGVWHHIAMDRDASNVWRIYVDGVMAGKVTISSTLHASTGKLSIGDFLTGGAPGGTAWQGWIDEIRITKGVARYASDAGFTVPAEAYPRA